MKVSEIKSHLFTLLTIFLWRKKEGKKGRLLTLSFFFDVFFSIYCLLCFTLFFFFEFPSLFKYFNQFIKQQRRSKEFFHLVSPLGAAKKKKNRKTECGVVCMLQNVHRFFCLVYLYTPYVEVERRSLFCFSVQLKLTFE